MKELFFLFSVLIAFGLTAFYLYVQMTKNEQNSENFNSPEEFDQLKMTVDLVKASPPGKKLYFILTLGGTIFSSMCVELINLPFTLVEIIKKKNQH